jgi:hypothetical protein
MAPMPKKQWKIAPNDGGGERLGGSVGMVMRALKRARCTLDRGFREDVDGMPNARP